MRASNSGNNGQFETYEDIMVTWASCKSQWPKGVKGKLEDGKRISLQFVDPTTNKRVAKATGCDLTTRGILQAIEKAHKVADALKRFDTTTEFWDWYNTEITGKKQLENDLRTYRQIFQEIEDEYFSGRHRNTGRKRSRDISSDVKSFYGTKKVYFKRFQNWDKYLEWDDFQKALFDYPKTPQGSKFFKDSLGVYKNIAEKGNAKSILAKLNKIDGNQTIFRENQSIDLDTFLMKYHEQYEIASKTKHSYQKSGKLGWLWVAAMCIMYGLRPSEIAAAQNLNTPCTVIEKRGKLEYLPIYDPKQGDAYYAISDPQNKSLDLVLGEFTYFEASIKTGGRVCYPIPSSKLQEGLKLQQPHLPITKSKNPDGFSDNFSKWIERNFGKEYSQTYIFRHLYNALGQLYGLSQEDRALNMGHTVAANDKHYKSRNSKNRKLRKQMLSKSTAIPYEIAKTELEHLGIDLSQDVVKTILNCIYRLEDKGEF